MHSQKSTYGLIGYPIKHSLSPVMHNTAFRVLGVEAVYELFPLKQEELEDFFSRVREETSPIFGFNVTIPYKEAVLPYMDSLSPYADKVRAVNTVVVGKDRKLIGHNTDGPGFLAHIAELGWSLSGKRVAILGAGGAARAIISVLSLMPDRPEAIRVYDIDSRKAQGLVADFGSRFDVSHVQVVSSIDDLNLELADALINATPIGMRPDDVVLIEDELLHPQLLVYDLIYNPKETPLLKMAARKGAKISNGLGMLFYQGVLAFQHWADIQLEQSVKDQMWQSLKIGLQND